MIDATLSGLGKIINVTRHPHLAPQYHILLHRPVPTYEPRWDTPDCCFISRHLWACTRWDYLRLQGSIVMEAQDIIQVRFVDRPVAWWIGKGRLAKKAVEGVEIMVEGERGLELFVELARVGFAYKGATRRRKKR